MGSKIVVIGPNCQIPVLAGCFSFLAPDADVTLLTRAAFQRLGSDAATLADLVSRADLVVGHAFQPGPFGPLGSARIGALAKRHVTLPVLTFSAFHPDTVYVQDDRGRSLRAAMGDYHSALVLYGHGRGFSVRETVSLFRKDVFARLGFLDGWFQAQDLLIKSGHRAGFDVAPLVGRWARRGCFMHTLNHPKVWVLCDMARTVLEQNGFSVRSADIADYLPDPLSNVVWPVYPDIAESLGLSGGYLFKRSSEIGAFRGAIDNCMGLDVLVDRMYAAYRDTPTISSACDRVRTWLGDERLRDAIVPARS